MNQLYIVYLTEDRLDTIKLLIGEFREYYEPECADLLKALEDKEPVYSEEELKE